MLEINNFSIVSKKDNRYLIKGLSLVLRPNDKIAIIGEEGNGKSSLIKAIVNKALVEEYCVCSGQIKLGVGVSVGYLQQQLPTTWNSEDVLNFFLKPAPDGEIDYDKYLLMEEISAELSKLGLNPKLLESEQKIGSLSGGEKVKLQLAKVLVDKPDILLLDEPTNDIDISTLEFMERFIKEATQSVIFVSHDEALLEVAANAILHIEQVKRKTEPRWVFERIGYKEYAEKRLHNLARQESIAKKQRSEFDAKQERWQRVFNKVEHQQTTISRGDPHGGQLLKKKMQTLKAQERRLEKQEQDMVELPNVEEGIKFRLSSEASFPAGKTLIELDLPELKTVDRVLAQNVRLVVKGPERVVITGKNGTGKTTIIKELLARLRARADIKLGYMPQNYDELVDAETLAVDFLSKSVSKQDVGRARTLLGSMKFTEEEMFYKFGSLSGGQKAKLFLLKLIVDECDVLLLDEPTRNLSPLSSPTIRRVLADFSGVIIAVSHDRKFIEEVATVVYALDKNGLAKNW